VLQFNKCYVGNVIHRRLHCVVISPVHPQRCKGSGPHNSPYSSTYHAQTTKPKRYWTSTKNQEIQTLLTTILSLWMLRDMPDGKSTVRMDFTHSSRKSWALLRHRGAAQSPPQSARPPVLANKVASHLVQVAKAPASKVLTWLADLFTGMIWEQRIPKTWRQVKIIALAKPGKDPHLAASYRPVSLLSVCYQLLVCTILQRISPTVEDLLSVDQAGFHRTLWPQHLRSTHSLHMFIENGFQKTLQSFWT